MMFVFHVFMFFFWLKKNIKCLAACLHFWFTSQVSSAESSFFTPAQACKPPHSHKTVMRALSLAGNIHNLIKILTYDHTHHSAACSCRQTGTFLLAELCTFQSYMWHPVWSWILWPGVRIFWSELWVNPYKKILRFSQCALGYVYTESHLCWMTGLFLWKCSTVRALEACLSSRLMKESVHLPISHSHSLSLSLPYWNEKQ